MPQKTDLDSTYMGTAILHSRLSKAIRKAVGAVLVTEHGVTLTGYNGTATGADNACETIDPETGEYITKPEVIHAELNCVLKAAKEGISVDGSTIYVTLSPCAPCAAMLVQVGIRELVFMESYRDKQGVFDLLNAGVKVRQYEPKAQEPY